MMALFDVDFFLTLIILILVVCIEKVTTFAPSFKKIVFHKFVWFRLVVSK